MWLEQDDQEREGGDETESSSGQIILGLVVHGMNFGLYSKKKTNYIYLLLAVPHAWRILVP